MEKNKFRMVGLLSLMVVVLSLFTFGYYTNIHKFLDEQNTSFVDGLGQKRLAEDFISDGCGIGTILDIVTGLCWDRNMNHKGSTLKWSLSTSYGEPTWNNVTKVYSYPSGKSNYPAFAYCEDLIIDGKDDFRLPTRSELMTLINEIGSLGTTCSTLEDDLGFISNSCQESYYWTSSEYKPSTTNAWIVRFNLGYGSATGKTGAHYVLCVR